MKQPPNTLLVELTKDGRLHAAATPEELVGPRIRPLATVRYMRVGAGTIYPEASETGSAVYMEDAKA